MSKPSIECCCISCIPNTIFKKDEVFFFDNCFIENFDGLNDHSACFISIGLSSSHVANVLYALSRTKKMVFILGKFDESIKDIDNLTINGNSFSIELDDSVYYYRFKNADSYDRMLYNLNTKFYCFRPFKKKNEDLALKINAAYSNAGLRTKMDDTKVWSRFDKDIIQIVTNFIGNDYDLFLDKYATADLVYFRKIISSGETMAIDEFYEHSIVSACFLDVVNYLCEKQLGPQTFHSLLGLVASDFNVFRKKAAAIEHINFLLDSIKTNSLIKYIADNINIDFATYGSNHIAELTYICNSLSDVRRVSK